ncbi:glycosyltransferase family 4 protein [Leptolyngbya sp. BL0902]|uniref:glycosyltransferase family 4 protein n=1 Tax=Leptolyngbya sp. BL0902 TaxID=1115757 RepID=UPI0018E6DF6E|nr:glycosyltransferase [Leptolyngbya sp. BL0902]
MADHIHSGFLAEQMSDTLAVPFVVRSHDIEHLHYGYWLKAAKGINKLKLQLAILHLKDYEWQLLSKCAAFYDISVDDLKFWQEQGFQNGRFLAPIADITASSKTDESINEPPAPEQDVVFLGNLRTENNVAGVLWFLQSVLPQLRQQRPDISVLISGSNPVPSVVEACEAAQVSLLPNPPSASRIYRSGKVLINPISTGSGTSIKSVDMLCFGKPIVTLEKGLFGLPQDARKYFKVATDADSFCQLILEGLEAGGTSAEVQAEIDSYFGYPVIQAFLDDLDSLVRAQAQVQAQPPATLAPR